MIRPAIATILSLAAIPAAGDILFAPPLDCDLTKTCYIQQTVDHDPGPAAQDFTCGDLTYDGHKGTDFALPSRAMQAQGVDVTAAAAGTVRSVRNDMVDILQGEPGAPDVSGRECGNGLVIDHGDGWETQYCHLQLGSLRVATGQQVSTGTVLGQVGLSGQSQFPHVHLSVRKDGDVVDPFAPGGQITCNTPASDTLWAQPVGFVPGGVISAGFSAAVPDYAAVKAGTAHSGALTRTAPGLVVWGFMFGGQNGDKLTLTIAGPEGLVFDDTQVIDRTQAQLFRAGGKRTPPTGWPEGQYTGTVILSRSGAVLDQQTINVTLY